MAAFPFNPAALLPPGQQVLEVQGRPARIRVHSSASAPVHEEWAIATFVPMPNLPAHFNNIRDLLGEFLTEVKHLPFSEISPSPLGQAYVRLNNVLDRDTLVHESPHQFGDIHVIFQRHNQGLNWRNLALNRDVWIQMVGFPFDKREINEVGNAVRSFAKF